MGYPTTTQHPKRYPYTSIMSSPYSCDPTGTLDCAAAIETLKAAQSNIGTIHVPVGSFRISTNLTFPSGMYIRAEAGAQFIVSTGVSVVVNCGFDSPLGEGLFATEGTGTVTFNTPAVVGSNVRVYKKGTYTFAIDTTITQDVQVEHGAILHVNNGVTLTITGSVVAGPYQIFSWSGSGKVTVARSPVLVEWWGTNNTAFQAAIDALPASGGWVKALGPSYAWTGGITLPSYTTLEFSIASAVSYDSTDPVAIKLTAAADYCIDSKVINPRITASGSGVSKICIQVYGGLRCRIDHPFLIGFTSGCGIELAGNEAVGIQDIKSLVIQPSFTNCLESMRFGGVGSTQWASEFTVIEGHAYWSGANTAAFRGYNLQHAILGTLIECSSNSPYYGGGAGSMTQAIGMRLGSNVAAIKIIGGNQEGMYDGTYISSSCNDITILGPAYYGNANKDINNQMSTLNPNNYLITSATGIEAAHFKMPAWGGIMLDDYLFIGNDTNGWIAFDSDNTNKTRMQVWSPDKTAVGTLIIAGRYQDPMTEMTIVTNKFHMALPAYANDAAAGVAGLVAGDWYQVTGTGVVQIKQ